MICGKETDDLRKLTQVQLDAAVNCIDTTGEARWWNGCCGAICPTLLKAHNASPGNVEELVSGIMKRRREINISSPFFAFSAQTEKRILNI